MARIDELKTELEAAGLVYASGKKLDKSTVYFDIFTSGIAVRDGNDVPAHITYAVWIIVNGRPAGEGNIEVMARLAQAIRDIYTTIVTWSGGDFASEDVSNLDNTRWAVRIELIDLHETLRA